MINIAMFAIVIASAIWVAIDSHKNKIAVDSKPYSANNGALAWLLSCIFLWIFLFPTYLFKRAKHLKAQGSNPTLGTVVGLLLIAVQAGIVLLMFTGDIKMSTADLQIEVELSIRETWSLEPTLADAEIKSFGLIHKTGNQYEGVLEVTTYGMPERIVVDVTYDGKQFMWQVRQ